MNEMPDSSITRAILHALPTAVLVLDSEDTIILANASASRLLETPRPHLEGGPLSRFVSKHTHLSSNAQPITFSTTSGEIELDAIAKELVVNDVVVRVVLLRAFSQRNENTLAAFVSGLTKSPADPFSFVCEALVSLGITKYACVRSTSSTQCEIIASTTGETEIFSKSPSIARSISKDETTNLELVILPNANHGLTSDDLATVDMFISLLQLRVDKTESASDASGSETALALALKAGDMGMCFFDTSKGDCYLSDRLATWCGINTETFSGTIDGWLESFREDDQTRIKKLFAELDQHNKFKTVVNVHTLEQDLRLELFGRPLHDQSTSEWVAIIRPYRDEQEVEAAWQTRIAMEESARVEAETNLESFEKTLTGTLLPTTSDVSIIHSRQDAGTWHIVRPLDAHTCIYALGAVTASNRTQAIVDATIISTIADVLASHSTDIEEFLVLVRDHARARDIETTISAVRVVNGEISAATHAGASVYISGKSLVGKETIQTTTAMSLSSHSEATPETIDVAANGRPWRIMTTVIEVISNIETEEIIDLNEPEIKTEEKAESDSQMLENIGTITGQGSKKYQDSNRNQNVSPFRSGSINPS